MRQKIYVTNAGENEENLYGIPGHIIQYCSYFVNIESLVCNLSSVCCCAYSSSFIKKDNHIFQNQNQVLRHVAHVHDHAQFKNKYTFVGGVMWFI